MAMMLKQLAHPLLFRNVKFLRQIFVRVSSEGVKKEIENKRQVSMKSELYRLENNNKLA